MLRFPDPAKLKTKRIVFEDAFHARDSGTLEQLKELSSRRKLIEDSINERSFITEAIAREMAGGLTSKTQRDLQKLEFYLPLLENFIQHVQLLHDNSKIQRWISDLRIQWTSALSRSLTFNLGGPKFYRIDSLLFEHGLSIYLYGAILRERAFETLSEDLVESATLYRKAAGVYKYLAKNVLPPLQPLLPYSRPQETISSMSEVMSLICLAEAQSVTIRKAEERNQSPGFISKLQYGVTLIFDEAASILKSDNGEMNDVSERLLDFISLCSFLHQLRSRRHLAEELAVEHRNEAASGQLGVAIGVLHYAIASSKSLKPPRDESWQSVVNKEISAAGELLRKLEHDNEYVYREKLPDNDQLPVLQGMRIVESIPYEPQRWERQLDFLV